MTLCGYAGAPEMIANVVGDGCGQSTPPTERGTVGEGEIKQTITTTRSGQTTTNTECLYILHEYLHTEYRIFSDAVFDKRQLTGGEL